MCICLPFNQAVFRMPLNVELTCYPAASQLIFRLSLRPLLPLVLGSPLRGTAGTAESSAERLVRRYEGATHNFLLLSTPEYQNYD